jgi:hypothetical protein
VARHTTHYSFVVPRNLVRVQICFSAPREPHDVNVSRARVTRAVDTRLSPCPLICHGSSPLVNRISADGAAGLPRRPLISGTPSVTSHKGCQGIKTACPVPGVLDVPISCRDSMACPGVDDRILEQGRVGEYVGLRIQPKTTTRRSRVRRDPTSHQPRKEFTS